MMTPITDKLDQAGLNARDEYEAAKVAAEVFKSHEQIERDLMTLALRLYGVDPSTFAPETAEVMNRYRPAIEAILNGDK
jgi:hypothetical protein